MTKYYDGLEYFDIIENNWKEDKKTKKLQKVVDCNVHVYHVPFCKQAKTLTTIDEIIKSSNKLLYEFDIQSINAPLCDIFTIKEVWLIL